MIYTLSHTPAPYISQCLHISHSPSSSYVGKCLLNRLNGKKIADTIGFHLRCSTFVMIWKVMVHIALRRDNIAKTKTFMKIHDFL